MFNCETIRHFSYKCYIMYVKDKILYTMKKFPCIKDQTKTSSSCKDVLKLSEFTTLLCPGVKSFYIWSGFVICDFVHIFLKISSKSVYMVFFVFTIILSDIVFGQKYLEQKKKWLQWDLCVTNNFRFKDTKIKPLIFIFCETHLCPNHFIQRSWIVQVLKKFTDILSHVCLIASFKSLSITI